MPDAAQSAQKDSLQALGRAAPILLIVLGAAVLVGWMIDSTPLKSIVPSFSQMKANTALCFILSGISLLFLRDGRKDLGVLRRLPAVLVFLIALSTLSEYIFGWSLGIDQLLFHDSSSSVATLSPGRMGANTAFNFSLAGLSLLTLDTEWRGVRLAQVGAIVIGLVAFMAVLGYAYGVSTLSTSFITKNVTPMALHTALTFIVLAAGLILVRPGTGMLLLARSPGPGGQLVRRLFLPVVLVPPLVGYVRLKGQEASLYGTGEGLAIYATSLVMMMGALVWGAARSLERERARSEEEREQLEAQLLQAQKMEAIGRLAGGVAHDFNNLLTVITGYSEMQLKKTREGEPLREEAEQIAAAADRATALTRQLLAFSRQQVLDPRVLDFNAAVIEIEPMLRRLIGEDIELTTRLKPDLDRVRADPNQIDQVILNLAVNARDAMPDGGRLTLETSNVEMDRAYVERHASIALDPGDYVMLAVSDSGTGIDPESQAQIFDPFFTTKDSTKGTGLGLSTVYGIVRQSGGAIWVYSEAGRGATFKVYLPRIDTKSEETDEATDLALEPDMVGATGTILLVEDEQAVRVLTRRILASAGYVVLEAGDGGEAIELCERHDGEIHLVVTDMVMPGISGLDLGEELLARRPNLRVIVMSGYSEIAIDDHGFGARAAFLQKPFSATALTRKVREVLGAEQ